MSLIPSFWKKFLFVLSLSKPPVSGGSWGTRHFQNPVRVFQNSLARIWRIFRILGNSLGIHGASWGFLRNFEDYKKSMQRLISCFSELLPNFCGFLQDSWGFSRFPHEVTRLLWGCYSVGWPQNHHFIQIYPLGKSSYTSPHNYMF